MRCHRSRDRWRHRLDKGSAGGRGGRWIGLSFEVDIYCMYAYVNAIWKISTIDNVIDIVEIGFVPFPDKAGRENRERWRLSVRKKRRLRTSAEQQRGRQGRSCRGTCCFAIARRFADRVEGDPSVREWTPRYFQTMRREWPRENWYGRESLLR